jgi:hypothetical protein
LVTADRVVVRTVGVSVVVEVPVVDGAAVAAALVVAVPVVATAATVAGCSGAFVTYRCVVVNPNELANTASVVSRPPSFSPQARTGPDRLRPGPVFAGIEGRVGELAFTGYMNTGQDRLCAEKQLRVRRWSVLS